MAAITIRSLPDEVVEALKKRAKRNSRSMEAEVRELLTRVVSSEAPSSGLEAHAREQVQNRRWSVPASEVDARIAANPPTREDRRVAEDWRAEFEADRMIPPDGDEFEDPWERAERHRGEWMADHTAPRSRRSTS